MILPLLLLSVGLTVTSKADDHADGLGRGQAEQLFALQVLPLLKSKCFVCHGEDADEIKGELNLLTRDAMLQGGESGEPALVPNAPDKSLLFQAVKWDGLEMPPKKNDRLTAAQIKTLRQWIAAGAPWPEEARLKEIRQKSWAREVTDEGVLVTTSGGLSDQWTYRRYDPEDLWAFRPMQDPDLPTAASSAAGRNPIDAFIERKLVQVDIQPASRTDARALARRAMFDLTGLPPTAQQMNELSTDTSALAYQRMIDRLLKSPHYGERMAQHWLDVVRYADTSGFSNDWERPHAWRYRDYVIRSFNEDKPFDQFVIEQIAGDELEPYNPQMRIAVGFLRMGPWEQTAMSVAAVTRQLWLDDVTNSVGETFLGHSLRCARCHDHKFDPIPTRDYYRIQAAFAGTQFAEPDAPLLKHENTTDATPRLATWGRQMSDKGLEAETQLSGDNAFSRIKKKLAGYRERALQRYAPKAFSVTSASPQPVSILIGGSLQSPGSRVQPGVLSAMTGADRFSISADGKGRRLALARWIADPDNTLTARVIVNRVWQWHFGRGLVATPNNFGKTGQQPSHPELLDYLARWLIEHDWSIKQLHRLIMTSDAYCRSSEHPEPKRLAKVDPNGLLLARFQPRRLSAEEIRDSMLAASGELIRNAGGPGVFPELNWEVALQPRHIMGGIAPSYRPSLTPQLRHRRTIYVFRYRGLADPMLEVFNRPNADLSCERRDETTVPTQAFALFNGQFAHDRALALAARISATVREPAGQVDAAFRLLYGRSPSDAERKACGAHLDRMQRQHRETPPVRDELPKIVHREMIAEQTGVPFRWRERLFLDGFQPDLKPWDTKPPTRALADVCLTLLNSSEFLYVY